MALRLREYQDEFLGKLKLKLKQNRNILSVLPCGAGKTVLFAYIADNHIKLNNTNEVWFIVHRKELIDQTIDTFNTFGISSDRIKIFMVQSLSNMIKKDKINGEPTMIIFDESHHCTSNSWLTIINTYPNAYKIGLTATPKETKEVSNISYFGEPIYTYSLKQGIDDGFLAPYKVIRINLDKDLMGYIPESGKLDMYGAEIEQREYNIKDFDKNIIIDDRTKKVAEQITEILKENDRFAKTIVFLKNL